MVIKQDAQALLRDGIDIAKTGDKKLAHTLLAKATRLDPQNENAWLWRASVAHDCAEAAHCLQHVLSLNPHNQIAIKGLASLGIKSTDSDLAAIGGNGSRLAPPRFYEAVTVPSRSKEILSAISKMEHQEPMREDSPFSNDSVDSDIRLDPVPIDQAEAVLDRESTSGDAISTPGFNDARQDLRILIVDDSPTIRKLVAMTLVKCGYEVVAASDGMEALARINDGAPDLILLDITMPRMDGYELCKTIKGNDTIDHIPIVMLTGKDGFMDKVRGRVVGSEGYLTKPFNPDDLVRMVKQHVGPA
jgi:twitching motility two-component system response regulator PilG